MSLKGANTPNNLDRDHLPPRCRSLAGSGWFTRIPGSQDSRGFTGCDRVDLEKGRIGTICHPPVLTLRGPVCLTAADSFTWTWACVSVKSWQPPSGTHQHHLKSFPNRTRYFETTTPWYYSRPKAAAATIAFVQPIKADECNWEQPPIL